MGDLLPMTQKELYRYTLIQKVNDKQLTQIKAAELLGISARQLRKLQIRVRNEGPCGVISKHRETGGNHRKPDQLKQSVLALVREKYEDCGPVFTKEKLEEWHDINISAETLRLWMIEAHLWIPRKKRKSVHLPRPRRDCFGELIQGDGSHHHWFGEDLPAVNATVFIDDATSTLTAIHFSEQETTEDYFIALEEHVQNYGLPLALYTDRYSVFKATGGNKKTQMHRALSELGIELILATSPQAKGRIERGNRTLQDRLVKEFRLRGIKTIEEANAFMPKYIKMHNEKFSKKPKSSYDAHRPLDGYDLKRILSHREMRTLFSSGIFQYNNKFFVVQNISEIRCFKGQKIEIYTSRDGKMRVFVEGKEVKVTYLEESKTPMELSRKEVVAKGPRVYKQQPKSHPWKRYSLQNELKRRAVI